MVAKAITISAVIMALPIFEAAMGALAERRKRGGKRAVGYRCWRNQSGLLYGLVIGRIKKRG